jgi:excisionase family DNA binding protein
MMLSGDRATPVAWITTGEAATSTGYVVEYVRCLAREGRIHAEKRGRDWWVDRDDLLRYKAQMDRLGEQKHNPWREDLVRQRCEHNKQTSGGNQ